MKLAGKTAIVSGSGRGIGRAVALKLAREGASVVVNDLEPEPAEETADEIRALGAGAAVCVGDVTAGEFADRFVGTAIERFGGLEIVVNNAGFTWDAVIHKMSDEQWDAILDVHAKAPFRIRRAAAGFMREAAKQEAEAGAPVCRKIVNVSSVSGLFGNAGQANYAAAKSAVVGLTKTLCKEGGRFNVTVNAVAFGLIETRMTQPIAEGGSTVTVGERELPAGMQPEMLETIRRLTPLGRAGTPEDAANAIYLFCCPESDFVSGQVLVASGGLAL